LDDGEKDLKEKAWNRKWAGWLLGSLGVASLLISIIGTVVMASISQFLFKVLEVESNSPGDPMPAVGLSYILMMFIGLIVVFVIAGVLSLIKIIAGVMIHRGRRKTPILVLLCIGISASFLMFLLFMVLTLALFSLLGILMILVMVVDLAIWGYMIYSVSRSWDTFKPRIKKMDQVVAA